MRNEIKFTGNHGQLRKVISRQAASRAYPTRVINSIYFDTPDFDDYNDSEEGSVPRRKTRLRWYGKGIIPLVLSGSLEDKSTHANHRDKSAFRIREISHEKLVELVNSIRRTTMRPVVLVSYVREYFATAGGLRFTLDRQIEYTALNRHFGSTRVQRDYTNVLELKVPLDVDYSHATKEYSDLRTRFSKYCQAVSVLQG